MTTLVRKTTGFQLEFIRHAQMPRLLNILGVSGAYTTWHNCHHGHRSPYSGKVAGSWWDRHEAELDWYLTEVHASYRRKAKELGIHFVENHQQGLLLNLAYQKVLRLFRNRGISLN